MFDLQIYRIMCITLGTPPSTVNFQYYTKDKDGKQTQERIGPISPRDFYHTLIKPDCLNMEDMVRGLFGTLIMVCMLGKFACIVVYSGASNIEKKNALLSQIQQCIMWSVLSEFSR